MRRNYTREALVDLCRLIRSTIPGVTLSTDLIVGFCDETEEEFQDTLSLVDEIKFETAFMFAYSMRERTHAHRNYTDNVPEEVK
jgi:tRNA A37 methylthiotransferase MiaB